jgi:hypothetical protein
MSMQKVRLTGGVADANVAAFSQHATAFPGATARVGQMMVDHRHEHEIGAAIREPEHPQELGRLDLQHGRQLGDDL